MYVSDNSVEEVISWFNLPTTRERILCLLAGNTSRDMQLLGQLFDNRGRISANLGDYIALFMFLPGGAPGSSVVIRTKEEGNFAVPGIASNMVYHEAGWGIELADRLNPVARDMVIQASQGITAQIRERFHLKREDLPCLVFLTRYDDLFIFRTQDSADLRIIEEFLRDLVDVAQVLDLSGTLDLPYELAQTRAFLAEKSEIDRQREKLRNALATQITSARESLKPLGLESMIDTLSPDSAYSVLDQLGWNSDPRRKPEEILVERARQALFDDEGLYREIKKISNAGKRLRTMASESEELSATIEERLARQMTRQAMNERLVTTEDEIEKICRQFEAKCRRRHQWRRFGVPAIQFIRALAQLVPTAGNVGALAQQIEQMSSQLSLPPPGTRR